jgi:hypothetical protein
VLLRVGQLRQQVETRRDELVEGGVGALRLASVGWVRSTWRTGAEATAESSVVLPTPASPSTITTVGPSARNAASNVASSSSRPTIARGTAIR